MNQSGILLPFLETFPKMETFPLENEESHFSIRDIDILERLHVNELSSFCLSVLKKRDALFVPTLKKNECSCGLVRFQFMSFASKTIK